MEATGERSPSATARIKTGLAIFGLSVLVLAAAELVATSAAGFGGDGGATDQTVEMEASPAYAGAAFDSATLFAEFRDTFPVAYQPYTVWSRRPYTGEMTNVDERGNRVTHHGSGRKDALDVWMFGGSTMWGTGAPDDQTIPSHLADILNRWGVDTNVRNLGETAYVSTQEVVSLLRELQSGGRPQVVVFYDGVNDSTSAALWPEAPGAHENLPDIRRRFEDDPESGPVAMLRSTRLYSAARDIADRLRGGESRVGDGSAEVPFREAATRAADVVQANYRAVAALGTEFGFTPVFVLQPALGVGDKPLAQSEEGILSRAMRDPARATTVRMYIELREELRRRPETARNPARINDLSDMFSELSDATYIDWAHITGAGNRLVAERISEVLTDRLCRGTDVDIGELTRGQLAAACP